MLAFLDESDPTELARLLGASLFSAQTIVDSLEREGILATRLNSTRRLARATNAWQNNATRSKRESLGRVRGSRDWLDQPQKTGRGREM